jgi:hypothetical protein
MTMTFADHLFKRRHFDRLIITLCVRGYVTYKLSDRDPSRGGPSGGSPWPIPTSCAGC